MLEKLAAWAIVASVFLALGYLGGIARTEPIELPPIYVCQDSSFVDVGLRLDTIPRGRKVNMGYLR